MNATTTAPGLPEIEQARARLDGVARVTPVYRSETLSRLVGRELHLKAENLQRTGSFKIRGAYNRISTLSADERAAGVVAASAGNHGQAVAWAAREVGARARIFMPQDAPMAKVEATRSYGAEIELTSPAFEDALAAARGGRRRARRDVRPSVRGRARDRGAGDDRARARGADRGRGDRRDPDRRRRARVGDRARAARRASGTAHRRRPGGGHAARRLRLHDRRRDRGQGAGRADVGNPRPRCSTRSSR